MNWADLDISVSGVLNHYRRGDFTPSELVDYLFQRSTLFEEKNIWIRSLHVDEISDYLHALEGKTPDTHPLYGVPFAIKDNIDLRGVDTTAGCEAYRYTAEKNAPVVQHLIDAGAIPIGKTNMDQFATGLVGTRSPSPWQACKNAFDDDYIAGGSSSGSAVAVSLGLVSFALGTDTAGSGRVPAAFNNLYGLKPTKGLISTSGVVPACRSLDVVTIFTLSAEDASHVFDVACEFDAEDPYARKNPFSNSHRIKGIAAGRFSLGVPAKKYLEFFGDRESESSFKQSIENWEKLGAEIVEVDFQAFLDAAKLLYEGPWVTERYIAIKSLLTTDPDAVHPVVREIIASGGGQSAESTFLAQYRLSALKREADATMAKVDMLVTPTTGTQFTIAEVLADPVTLNSQLGYYTNFMNLLDYSAIAVPAVDTTTPIPSGFTLIAQKFQDQKLLAYAKRWQQAYSQNLGKTKIRYHKVNHPVFHQQETIDLVVCGAHLAGHALNWQLTDRGGYLLQKLKSAPHYRLYALADGKRPGMIRDSMLGGAISVEVWRVPSENVGSFVAAIPAPLGIGKVELEDGTWKSGFICDQYGLEGAREITQYGGWTEYLASK